MAMKLLSIDALKVNSSRFVQGEIAKSAKEYQKKIAVIVYDKNMYADKKLQLITDLVETFNVDKTFKGNKLQDLFDGFKPAYLFFKKALNANKAKEIIHNKGRLASFRQMNEVMDAIETITNSTCGQKDVEVISELRKLFSKGSREPSMNAVIKNRRFFVA